VADTARAERVKIGPRLFKVADRFFVRVPVPRALREVYRTEGKSAWEVFESLRDDAGNPARDRREAEHLCRRRGAEIDAEFKRKRVLLEQQKRILRPLARNDVERVAIKWFNKDFEKFALADLSPLPVSATEADAMIDLVGQLRGQPIDNAVREEAKAHLISDQPGRAFDYGLAVAEAVTTRCLATNDFKPVSKLLGQVLKAENLMAEPDSIELKLLAQTLMRGVLENIRQRQQRREGDLTGTKVDPLFNKVPADTPADGITLEHLIKQYQNDRGKHWTQKTRDGYALIFRALEELLGKHKGVKRITRDDCRRVRDILVDLAPNYTKLPATRGKPMEEAARISRDLALPRRRPESVNSYLNNLAALFNYALEEEYIDRHPAKKLQVPVTIKKKDRRQPFDTDQLKAIFNAPLYTGCIDDENGYAKAGPNVIRRGRFWVPLLSLWTGMRLNECCQLLVDDVRYVDNVPVVIISEDSEDGVDDKRVKTEAGERYVPVHPELERIGFIKHWQQQKRRGERRLFPDLPASKNGYYSDPFQKWFGRFLANAGAKKPRTSFHSFRHTYRDALREADISAERVKALGGWANTETQEDYGKGLRPATLYHEIKKVKFQGLSLVHLHV
jgi:integrase